MRADEFAVALGDWRRTGFQDAANVMDPGEIEEKVGRNPSAEAVERWLLDTDPGGYLDLPEDATGEQKEGLLKAWAHGWSTYASRAMADG